MLDRPDLAGDDRAQVETGPEAGGDAEIGFICRSCCLQGVGDSKYRPHAARALQTLLRGPGKDHLVTDVAVHLAPMLYDARGDVADEPAEEGVIAKVAKAFGDLRGLAQVDEQEDRISSRGR